MGRQCGGRAGVAMLSMSTLWIVFVINFLALALLWGYVMRSYPTFAAAHYLTAAAFFAATGAALSMLRSVVASPLLTLLISGALLIFACCLSSMGVRRFYGKPAAWGAAFAMTGACAAGMAYFVYVQDSVAARILIYSLGQSIPMALILPLTMLAGHGRVSPGARLTTLISILIIAINAARAVGSMLSIGGESSMLNFNSFQASLVLVLVFLSMAWNFGFLLMAIDRLRAEVADLALIDDLTGVANRRHLLQRLAEETALSQRTGEAFALLAIDLDGFKAINDSHGHGAGDECLRLFTRAAQSRLRPGDLLSRSGGDEFSIVLPATTLREGAMIARHILETCREQFARQNGASIQIAASVGVAQWSPQIGGYPERLIAAADQALYVAKNGGKNRYALYEPEPKPEPEPLRKSA